MRSFQLPKFCILWLVVLSTVTIGCSSKQSKAKSADSAVTSPDSLTIEYTGADSSTVFDLLLAAHTVDYQATAAGAFVKGIDSVYSGDGYFWLYSVNDTAGQVASDRYMTRSGDVIKWHFRRAGE